MSIFFKSNIQHHERKRKMLVMNRLNIQASNYYGKKFGDYVEFIPNIDLKKVNFNFS